MSAIGNRVRKMHARMLARKAAEAKRVVVDDNTRSARLAALMTAFDAGKPPRNERERRMLELLSIARQRRDFEDIA